MDIERLDSSAFAPKTDLLYVDENRLHSLYDKLAFRSNLILVGPKGVAKSLSVASYCGLRGYRTVTYDCSEDSRRSHLLGMFVLRGDRTPFVLGPLTTAIEVANEVGSCVLVLEEINSLSGAIQKILNPVTDFRRRIEVPEAKTVFQLNPDAKLWVVGLMNNLTSGGVYRLNDDLKSRFRMAPIGYPSEAAERRILQAVINDRELQIPKDLVSQLLTLAKHTRQNTVEYALSTRDLVAVLEDTVAVGIERALWLVLGKYEDQDRATLLEWILSIFGLTKASLK